MFSSHLKFYVLFFYNQVQFFVEHFQVHISDGYVNIREKMIKIKILLIQTSDPHSLVILS